MTINFETERDEVLQFLGMDHLLTSEDCHDVNDHTARYYFSVIQQLGRPTCNYQLRLEWRQETEYETREVINYIDYTFYSKLEHHEDWNIIESDEYLI